MKDDIKNINERLDRLERITLIGTKNVLDMEEASLFTGFSRGHLYRLTSTQQIPHFKKSRKLYFRKDELEAWMLEVSVPTQQSIERQAQTYISTHR